MAEADFAEFTFNVEITLVVSTTTLDSTLLGIGQAVKYRASDRGPDNDDSAEYLLCSPEYLLCSPEELRPFPLSRLRDQEDVYAGAEPAGIRRAVLETLKHEMLVAFCVTRLRTARSTARSTTWLFCNLTRTLRDRLRESPLLLLCGGTSCG